MKLTHNTLYLGFFVSCPIILLFIWKRIKRHKSTTECPKDTVIFHQTGRGPFAPSLTPFAVKLETYLRAANIPYKNVHDKVRSTKGKWPWIEYNGKAIPDSQLIIEFLNKTRGVDLNKQLTEEQRAAAVSLQRMVDEHTYWMMVICRWNYDPQMTVFKLAGWSSLKITIARWLANRQTYFQGLGRHNKEEIMQILDKDFKTLSTYLGCKKFIFGDDVTETDCSLFGQLSQFRWHLPIKEVTELFERYPNLDQYCENMKQTFWSDWNECITQKDAIKSS